MSSRRGYQVARSFDTISIEWIQRFVEHRLGDKRVLRLLRKWLRAGVIENGQVTTSAEGTPQGATLSPLLANVYLHYVFDLWVQRWRSRRARGDVVVVRYADDIVVGFQHRADADCFRRDLEARLQRFALALHPDKTRLIEFGRYAAERRAQRGERRPETFDFLGFTHSSGRARSGNFLLYRQTSRKRMKVKLAAVKHELMRRRHLSIKRQGRWLRSVVQGHLNYYAIPTNSVAIQQFRKQVVRHWYKALRRRSQRDCTTWRRMRLLENRWLPRALILHPYSTERFDAKTQGGSPVR